jgi:hypothetical protein
MRGVNMDIEKITIAHLLMECPTCKGKVAKPVVPGVIAESASHLLATGQTVEPFPQKACPTCYGLGKVPSPGIGEVLKEFIEFIQVQQKKKP